MANLYLGKQTIISNNNWDFGNASLNNASRISVNGSIISLPPDFGTFGNTWVSYNDDLNPSNISSVAISSSGKYGSITINGGYIYVSNDYGGSWVQSESLLKNWKKITITALGKNQSACVYGGSIYYSLNYGVNWVQSDASNNNWSNIASSASGKYQSACITGGACYYSNNYGINWHISDSPISDWKSIAISSDGSKQTLVSSSYVYSSVDYGETWNSTIPDDVSFSSVDVAMSSKGDYQTIITNGNGIYY